MSQGYFTSQAVTSNASIPVENATVIVTQGQTLLAVRTTDRSGNTAPIAIDTPELSESLSPDNGVPFALVDVAIDHPEYQRIVANNVQIFPNVYTRQTFALIPLSALPEQWNQTETFDTPPQNL